LTRNPVRHSNLAALRAGENNSGFRVKPGMTRYIFDCAPSFASPGMYSQTAAKKRGRMIIRPYTIAGHKSPPRPAERLKSLAFSLSVSPRLPLARSARAGCGEWFWFCCSPRALCLRAFRVESGSRPPDSMHQNEASGWCMAVQKHENGAEYLALFVRVSRSMRRSAMRV
jgi:hypothetical protein